jgi:hypothetical protein
VQIPEKNDENIQRGGMKMHYNDWELYLYYKKENLGVREQIKKHLEKCGVCRKKMLEVTRVNRLFMGTLKGAPSFASLTVNTKKPAGIWEFVLKSGFAAATAIVIAIIAVTGTGAYSRVQKNNVHKFVYNTYRNFYDFDYYTQNYVENIYLSTK